MQAVFSERILRAQSGSQEDMLFIIQKFEPQLKHYSRRLHSEDAQSELTLRFIETIHAMNLDSLRSQGDGTIVAYLAQYCTKCLHLIASIQEDGRAAGILGRTYGSTTLWAGGPYKGTRST